MGEDFILTFCSSHFLISLEMSTEQPQRAKPTGPKKGKNNKNRHGKRSAKKNHAKTSWKPQYMEILKLVRKMDPLTINGVAVDTLDKPVDDYIKELLENKAITESLYMSFIMAPSDPDFPYDLDFLKFTLCVPRSYPRHTPNPTIMVLNDDIPRGYSVNIELGFKQIAATAMKKRHSRKDDAKDEESKDEDEIEMEGGNDLLAMIKTLGKYLEKFLSMQKKDTVKIVKVIKKQDEERERQLREEKQRQEKAKEQKRLQQANIDPVMFAKRNNEIDQFKQRLQRTSHIRLFKDSPHSTIFKLELHFQDGTFTIEIEDLEIVLEKLPVKLTIPKEYLGNKDKPLNMELDMSNTYNLKMIKSLEDPNVRNLFGKLIHNLNINFNYLAHHLSKTDTTEDKHWTITSQLNFFVENIQKFMNLKPNFVSWYEENTLLNDSLA